MLLRCDHLAGPLLAPLAIMLDVVGAAHSQYRRRTGGITVRCMPCPLFLHASNLVIIRFLAIPVVATPGQRAACWWQDVVGHRASPRRRGTILSLVGTSFGATPSRAGCCTTLNGIALSSPHTSSSSRGCALTTIAPTAVGHGGALLPFALCLGSGGCFFGTPAPTCFYFVVQTCCLRP